MAILTSDVEDFVDHLRPGDVLLFDSINWISQLVKLAENRPVNHCAVYVGHGSYIEVGRSEPAVAKADLLDKLRSQPDRAGPYHRTITSLRHMETHSGSDAASVVARAYEYLEDGGSRYSYLSLGQLMIPSFYRTYSPYVRATRLGQSPVGSPPLAALRLLGQLVMRGFGETSNWQFGRYQTLTCSEFVYRCYAEAQPALGLRLRRPLMYWNPDLWKRVRSRSIEVGSGGEDGPEGVGALAAAVDADDPVQFDDSFVEGLVSVPSAWLDELDESALEPRPAVRGTTASAEMQSVRGVTTANGDIDLKEVTERWAIRLVRHNARTGKYSSAAEGDILPDGVTPRDLWSSPSLRAVAVYHCPPDPNEVDLDILPPPAKAPG